MTSEWHEVSLRELVGYMSKGIAPRMQKKHPRQPLEFSIKSAIGISE